MLWRLAILGGPRRVALWPMPHVGSGAGPVSIDWKASMYEGALVIWVLWPLLDGMRQGERNNRINSKDVVKFWECMW